MFNRDERLAKADAKTAEQAEKFAPDALRALQQRRAWLLVKIATDAKGNISGGGWDDDMETHARALFYLDHAIAELQRAA